MSRAAPPSDTRDAGSRHGSAGTWGPASDSSAASGSRCNDSVASSGRPKASAKTGSGGRTDSREGSCSSGRRGENEPPTSSGRPNTEADTGSTVGRWTGRGGNRGPSSAVPVVSVLVEFDVTRPVTPRIRRCESSVSLERSGQLDAGEDSSGRKRGGQRRRRRTASTDAMNDRLDRAGPSSPAQDGIWLSKPRSECGIDISPAPRSARRACCCASTSAEHSGHSERW